MDPRVEQFFDQALRYISQGNYLGAIDLLKRALSIDPDDAEAHGLLAVCLLDTKRIHAAQMEAGIALALNPESTVALFAMGVVRESQRKFKEAEDFFQRLLDLEPGDPSSLRAMARLYTLTGRGDEALALLKKALEIDPEDCKTLSRLGSLLLSRGDISGAYRCAREALEISPEHLDSVVLMGQIGLRKGDLAMARENAIWALQLNAADGGALNLIASIKARENIFLGLWWRYNVWMGELGNGRAIFVLLGAFVIYRLLGILFGDLEMEPARVSLKFAWLGICVYTWTGPAIFQRFLKKELGEVHLHEEF